MTPLLVGLVLTAAVLHAVWNAMAKSGGTPEMSIASYQLVGSLVCILLAVWLPFPDGAAWPMIIHVGSMRIALKRMCDAEIATAESRLVTSSALGRTALTQRTGSSAAAQLMAPQQAPFRAPACPPHGY